MAPHSHSDLEVAPSAGLEVDPSTADLDTYKYPPYYPTTAAHDEPAPQTICGLRKRTFWIVVIAAVVIVASAVGGGVGGALATRKSGETTSTRESTTSIQPTPTVPPSTSSNQTISTTAIVGPTNSPQPTLLRDCPSSNGTLYSVSYGSTSYQFRKLCNGAYTNTDGVSAPAQGIVKSLDECINICSNYNQNNRTEIQAGRVPICNTVCWRNTFNSNNDWEGGRCFGFTTRNVTINGHTEFSLSKNVEICDSAALINQDF